MDTRSPSATAPLPAQSLPPLKLAAFSSAALSVTALITPLSVYLPNYYASHLGLPLALVGAAFALVRLIDILVDPIIGIAINATRTPIGRFRPWMIAGIPILLVAVYAIYMAKPGISEIYVIGWLLVLYAGFSMLTLGHSAWAAALVPEYHQRSRIYGWIQAVGVFGSITVLSLPSFWPKDPAGGIHAMGWFVIVVAPLSVAVCLAAIGEPRHSERADRIGLRDYWAMFARPSLLRLLAADLALALAPAITAALYLFFFEQFLGYTRRETSLLLVLYIAAGLFGAPTWALVAKRLGKHQTVMLACVLYGFAQALVFVLPKATISLMAPAMFLAGFVVSAFSFLIRAMIADVGDEVRLDIGKDRTALLYGLVTSTSKVGSTISIPITFTILQVFGFDAKEGAVNSGVAIDALVACYVVVPVLTMFVGAFMLRGYRLDAVRHDEIRAELHARDNAIEGAEGVIESLTGAAPGLETEPRFNPGE